MQILGCYKISLIIYAVHSRIKKKSWEKSASKLTGLWPKILSNLQHQWELLFVIREREREKDNDNLQFWYSMSTPK